MNFAYLLAMKLIWWVLPKVVERVSDYYECALRGIEEGARRIEEGAYANGTTARHLVLQRLNDTEPSLPEWVHRGTIEICCILSQIGITAQKLDAMTEMVIDPALHDMDGKEKRDFVLERFGALFGDVPETSTRLLVEWALAKVRARSGGV